jgi:hypothetical protein
MVKGEVRWNGPSFGLEHDRRVCRRDSPQQVEFLVGERAAAVVASG